MSSGAAPVILLGAQRSGTSALGAALDAAFDEVGGVFTINGKLPYLLHRWCTDADLRGRHLRSDEIGYALRRKPPYGRHSTQWLEATEKVLHAAAADVANGTVADAVALRRRLVRDAYAAGSRFGDKYNEYLLELDALADTVPDAHWVLLVRHPVDVARSTLRWTGDRPWRPGTWRAVMDKWVAWHEPWLRHPRATDPRRCTVLEYRRLCAGEDLRRLSAAIDLDLAPHAGLLSERGHEPDRSPLPERVAQTWRRLVDRRSSS
jgi:hypothetical protein